MIETEQGEWWEIFTRLNKLNGGNRSSSVLTIQIFQSRKYFIIDQSAHFMKYYFTCLTTLYARGVQGVCEPAPFFIFVRCAELGGGTPAWLIPDRTKIQCLPTDAQRSRKIAPLPTSRRVMKQSSEPF